MSYTSTTRWRCAAITAFSCWTLVCQGSDSSTTGQTVEKRQAAVEPNLEIASSWWTELPNKTTPVGWKDHLHKFIVRFDGTLIAVPVRAPRTPMYVPHAQFTFGPCSSSGKFDVRSHVSDTGCVKQGWDDGAAPVLWSEWILGPALMRQEVFAHVTGGQDLKTGTEPLFAWVRLSVFDRYPGFPLPEKIGFQIRINQLNQLVDVPRQYNPFGDVSGAKYPSVLTPSSEKYDREKGFRLLDQGNTVRLVVPPGQNCAVAFAAGKPKDKDYTLEIMMDSAKGSHVDVLIPFVPAEKAAADKETAVGYDGALAEANRYWSKLPSTVARFDVPEEMIGRSMERNMQMAEVMAEKLPDGQYCVLSGVWNYGYGLWPTPSSMVWASLDYLGYHSVVEKYIEVFKRQQGTVVPPGPAYKLHPGYLSSPKSVTSIDWVTDHGAILRTICDHALLTGDQKFIDQWLPTIIKACEWIKDARRLNPPGSLPGCMAPASATDGMVKAQSVWGDGWVYKGLTTAVRLLEKIHHPRAAEFAAEARDYREAFTKAYRARIAKTPRWTDSKGKVRPLPPAFLSDCVEGPWDWALMDSGSLSLVYLGLLDATDGDMESARLFFREGPATKNHRYDAEPFQGEVLEHEMSSFEPCYSWNIYHSWQLGDRAKFLEGLYSLFAGAISRQTYTVCEERGGASACCFWLPSIHLARLAVIDDEIKENELHLLRLMPLAWLRTDRESKFENMPTVYGPVTLRAGLAQGGAEMRVSFTSKYRVAPERVVLHIPPVKGLKKVSLNGKPLAWDGSAESLIVK